MIEAAVEAQFRWEFGKAVVHVHLNAVVLAATLVWWLESAAIGWAGEGEEFVEAVAQTTHCAVGAIDSAVGPSGLATVLLVFTNDLLRDLNEPIHDVADGTAELARGRVSGTRRCLDVGDNKATESGEGGSDDEEFFHAAE